MIIEELDGTRIDIAEYGLKRLFHRVPSAGIEHTSSSVEGKTVVTESNLSNRTIEVELLYISRDIYDYDLLRDELNALFMRTEPYYIIFKREKYKRWLVKVAEQYAIPPHPNMQSFTLNFLTMERYAESVGTSLELVYRDFDSGLWGWGSGVNVDEPYQYTFNTNSFAVHNIGNAEVDPRESFLEIEVKGVFSNGFTLTNETTGDVYQFNEALTSTDTLLIKGIRTLKNGVSKFGATNKMLIRLAPGANQISITGGTVSSVVFNFRFLYK